MSSHALLSRAVGAKEQDRANRGAPACELSIVIPCLNESETLAICVRKAIGSLKRLQIDGEVIVADNGSIDGSPEIATCEGARVVDVQARGYGAALHGGITAARGKYVIMGDADDSYDFANIDGFVEHLRGGYDLVMGNRFAGAILPGAMPWLHKWVGNPGLTKLGRLFFHSQCGDFYCGLRGFSKEAWRQLDLQTTGMEYAVEMVIKTALMGMNVTEVPITLSRDGRSRPPHLRTWRDGWRTLRFMLAYSPTWLFIIPGLILLALGTLVFGWLLPGPQRMFGAVFDVHTLLTAACIMLLGFQALSFGLLARVFIASSGLIPTGQDEPPLFKHITLEVGICLGLVCLTIGAMLMIGAFATWANRDFGSLSYSLTMRQVIPSVLMLVLGAQIVFNSFFLSLLRLPRR